MKELVKHLKPLKRKMVLKMWLETTAVFLSLGFGCCAVLLIFAKFYYIDNLAFWLGGIVGLSLILGGLAAFLQRPDHRAVAACGDGLGFKERFITAIELIEIEFEEKTLNKKNDPVSALVVEDAVHMASAANFRKLYPIKLKRNILLGLVCSLAFMCITGFTPSPVPEKLGQERELQMKMAEQAKLLEGQKEALLKEASAKEAAAIEKILKEMNMELKKAKTESDGIKAVKKAQEALTKLSKDSVHKDLKELGEKLQNHESTKALGAAIERGDTKDIADSIEKLNETLETATKAEQGAIADALRDAAEQIAQDNMLRDNLNALADSINGGNLGDYGDQIMAFNDLLNEMAADNGDLKAAIDQYKAALGNASQQLQSQQDRQEQGQSGSQGDSGSQGEGQGQGQGEGNGDGGVGDDGAGNGQGSGRGRGHKENENIYSRDAASKGDQNVNIQGTMNENGEILTQDQKTLGEAGEAIPYGRVYEAYRQEALNSLEDYDIPYGMREIVKDYFSTLD